MCSLWLETKLASLKTLFTDGQYLIKTDLVAIRNHPLMAILTQNSPFLFTCQNWHSFGKKILMVPRRLSKQLPTRHACIRLKTCKL